VQVEGLLRQIGSREGEAEGALTALETLAKVAWNDDEARS
jgi:hypothetical protein